MSPARLSGGRRARRRTGGPSPRPADRDPWRRAQAELRAALGIPATPALTLAPGHHLALALDGLVVGRHFFPDVDPARLGHKALAVNLSDLAAMGAEPLGCQVLVHIPAPDSDWLVGFARGLANLAREQRMSVIGAELVEGPLNITVEVSGQVPAGQALTRGGARPGDLVGVTGTLGDAGAVVAARGGELTLPESALDALAPRLDRPEPRLAAGVALRGRAHAAIDVSDGLAADLGHILKASGVGARLDAERLPLSPNLERAVPRERAVALALGGGDDYELCITLPEAAWAEASTRLRRLGVPMTRIGVITSEPGLTVLGPHGPLTPPPGYDHFGRDSDYRSSASSASP